MDHHKTLSPSSFPMKSRCPHYKSGEAGAAAQRGSEMHDAFANLFDGGKLNLFSMDEGDLEEIQWAKETVDAMISKSDPIEVEVKLSYTDAKFRELYFGHGDIVNGPTLFDLKTGERHAYWLQMAGYALALMDQRGYDKVDVHLLYSRYRKVDSYTITRSQAEPPIMDLIIRSKDPDAPYKPNEFCGWCDKRVVCPALAERVEVIQQSQDWGLDSYRVDEIAKDPKELSKAIGLAKLMQKWSYAITDLAKEFDEIPGYKWKEVKGRRSLKDTLATYKKAELTVDEFLRACNVSLSSLEKAYKDKGMTLKEAKEFIAANLSELIEESQPYKKLEEK